MWTEGVEIMSHVSLSDRDVRETEVESLRELFGCKGFAIAKRCFL